MMKRWIIGPYLSMLILLLPGCSSDPATELNYRDSEITPTLELPPDLISRSSDSNLTLPGSKVGTDENRGRYVETGNLNIESKTLPTFKGMRIEGEGDFHWLVVDAPAQEVYPMVREFWADQGFVLIQDEPVTGVMVTQWMSQRSGRDSFFASILESLRGAESKDQYKIRLQRASDTATHIYLAHRGQEQIIDDAKITLANSRQGWQFTPADPAKEYEMLSRLMLFLGMQDDEVKQQLAKIGAFEARAAIEYDSEEEQTYLLSKQGFEQTWNRLVHQLDRRAVNIAESEKGDNEGSMRFNSADINPQLEQAIEAQSVEIILEGSRASNTTRIDVIRDGDTRDQSEAASQLLQYLLTLLK